MKIKKGFVLRKVGKQQVAVPLGEAMKDLNGLIKLNESGVILWKRLEEGAEEADLVQALLDFYDVDAARAEADVKVFIENLKKGNCIE